MRNSVKIRLSPTSVEKAIQDLEQLKRQITAKTETLTARLADIALNEADERFKAAQYDGNNDVRVYAEHTEKGYRVVAEGKAVFFIEFGAGVHYNGSEPYPEPRPSGIVGIGQYGKGLGKRDSWRFKDGNDNIVKTYGNPAAMPMLFAREAVLNEAGEVAKEVFAND